MDTTKLVVECSAKTVTGKFVTLPEGAEVQGSKREIVAAMNNAGQARSVRMMVRCPKAKNPAPYDIDLSDLWLAVA